MIPINIKNTPSIYTYTNKITGRIYIGQTIETRQKWTNHLSELRLQKHRNAWLQRSWNKHGKENFHFEIYLDLSMVPEEFLQHVLDTEEQELIATTPLNYNGTKGGAGNFELCSHAKEKLTPIRKKQWQLPGFRENQIACQKRNWENPEYREHQINKKKQYWKDPEIRAKYLAAFQSNWDDPEYRKRQTEKIREGIKKAKKANGGKFARGRSETRSEFFKNRWKNPATRKEMIRKMKAGWAKKKAAKLQAQLPHTPVGFSS